MINAHIISHTHWDREWFLNSKYTREWLVPFFDSLFEMLENEKDYRFVLDGQTLMIEDYFNELKIQNMDVEEKKELIKKYAVEGRLLVGPYYLQPDWQLISEESVVRNMLIGHQMASNLGNVIKAGWLLDNFGQISQTVQIHKEFNMEGLFLWRGVEMEPDEVKSEFNWKGPDGSELTSIYFLSSYRNAMRLADYEDIFEERIMNEVEKIYPFATTSNLLLMNGYDQEMVPDDIIPKLNKLSLDSIKVKQSTPEEYLEAIKSENPELQTLENELYSGRYISVFPGILSSRMYLKLMNDLCERELTNNTEPYSVLSWLFGGDYNSQAIKDIWKMLLRNHPHDSICGVSIDDVHTDMEARFDDVFKKSSQIKHEKIKQLTSLVNTEENNCNDLNAEPYIVFNSHYKEKNAVISIDRCNKDVVNSSGTKLQVQREKNKTYVKINKIPSMGYKTLYLVEKEKIKRVTDLEGKVIVKGNVIKNDKLSIKINDDGTFDVSDKINQKLYQNLGEFVDSGDAGDEYNYSYPKNDKKISSKNSKVNINFLEKGPIIAVCKIDYIIEIPISLNQNRTSRLDETIELPLTNYIILEAGSNSIKFKTDLKNTAKDHRIRAIFPTDIETNYSYAGTQFDITKHKIIPKPFDNSNIDENVKRIIIGARESEPITTFPQQYFVDINNDKYGIALLNKGLPEYEILPDSNSIALTLFRSVGWLARGDLLTRVGDAGPIINTPDAQCLREMSFEYSLLFHKGDHEESDIYNKALSYNNELQIVKTDLHSGYLKDKKEIIKINGDISLSAFKLSEDGKSLILRLFNVKLKQVDGVITTDFDILDAYEVDMEEKIKSTISVKNKNKLEIELGPKKIKTIKLEVKRKGLDVFSSQNDLNVEALKETNKFKLYKTLPLIIEDDVESEKQRWKKIEKEIELKKQKSSKYEKILNDKELSSNELNETNYKYHKIIGDTYSDERASLEAELSYVLSEKKYLDHTNKLSREKLDSIDNRVRSIGFKLNKARVNKRVYEYIVEYYKHKLK